MENVKQVYLTELAKLKEMNTNEPKAWISEEIAIINNILKTI